MTNITQMIADLEKKIDDLKNDLAEAEESGASQDEINAIQGKVKDLEDKLKSYKSFPTAGDIADGNFNKPDKVANNINAGQINFQDITEREVGNMPIFVTNEKGDIILTTLMGAFSMESADDLGDTIDQFITDHARTKYLLERISNATSFTAVNDKVPAIYGWSLSPLENPYTFGIDTEYSTNVPLIVSLIGSGKYFPKLMVSKKGFKVEANGKSYSEGNDLRINSLSVGGSEFVHSIEFVGGYQPQDGDNIWSQGYVCNQTVVDVKNAIDSLNNHVDEVYGSFKTFEDEHEVIVKSVEDLISLEQESIASNKERIAELAEGEATALKGISDAKLENEAISFRDDAENKMKQGKALEDKNSQSGVELVNADLEKAQLSGAIDEATVTKDKYCEATAPALITVLEALTAELTSFGEGEGEGDDGDDEGYVA